MITAALRTPRQTPLPSPKTWFQPSIPIAASWSMNNLNGSYYNGVTYMGFVDGNGSIRVMSYNHAAQTFTLSPVIVSALDVDGHASPSVLVRSSDHRLLLAVSGHSFANMYIAVSTNAEDVTAWGAATDISGTLTSTSYTYANLFQLSGESGKIYLFYREGASTTGSLCFSTSTNAGSTWAARTLLYENINQGAYWGIGTDSTNRIDIVTSDGNALSSNIGSAYHMYYTGGSWHKSNGTTIAATMPFAPTDLTLVYSGATSGYVRAPYACMTNGGSPVGVWAAYNSAGTGFNEQYWYAIYSGGAWHVSNPTDTGAADTSTHGEGGITIDRTNPSRIFVSKYVSGMNQIFAYTTPDNGSTWTGVQLTDDPASPSGDVQNNRPVSPRDASPELSCFFGYGFNLSNVAATSSIPAAQIRCYPNPRGVF